MPFWDSSAIVPLFCRQPQTSVVRKYHRQLARIVVWWGTPVEIQSALARLRQEGLTNAKELDQALKKLALLRNSWSEIVPTTRLRDLAQVLPSRANLRAADAFQLAAALVWTNEHPRRRPFVCFDAQLATAARSQGFTVYD